MKAAAAILAQEKASFARVEPPCPYFGTCGGCAMQDLAYEDQLRLKGERIRRALAPLGDVAPCEVIGLEEPWRYRNKAELTFGGSSGALTLGYHAARSFWRVVDLEDCLLLPEPMMRAAREGRTLASATGLPAYQPKTHQGFFRYLLVRGSRLTGKVMACFITTSGLAQATHGGTSPREMMEGLAQQLMARQPSVSSVYWGITDRLADIALPETLTHLRGDAYLDEQVGPFRLTLHPLSFIQPSTVQADRMCTLLTRELGERREAIAWDLYCGIGLISLYLSSHVRSVYAIDVEPHHLELAALNASSNQVSNVEFRLGSVEALLRDRRFWLQDAKPEIIVVDPPRPGLHPDVCASLLAARPSRIAYFSCNVQSLVRDLQVLCCSFPRYRLSLVQPFDMFPQTNHVEILALLDR